MCELIPRKIHLQCVKALRLEERLFCAYLNYVCVCLWLL